MPMPRRELRRPCFLHHLPVDHLMGDRTRPAPSVQAFNETLAAPKFDVVVVWTESPQPGRHGVGIVLPVRTRASF